MKLCFDEGRSKALTNISSYALAAEFVYTSKYADKNAAVRPQQLDDDLPRRRPDNLRSKLSYRGPLSHRVSHVLGGLPLNPLYPDLQYSLCYEQRDKIRLPIL